MTLYGGSSRRIGDPHLPTQFPVEVLDAARPFLELLVVTGLSRGVGMQQRAEKALASIASGMRELQGRNHGQAAGTQGDALGGATAFGMPMQIEGDGGHASTKDTGLVDIPGIKSGISRDVEGIVAQVSHGLQI